MTAYFNNHTQRLSQTPTSGNFPSNSITVPNAAPPPLPRLDSKLFSTTVASMNDDKEKGNKTTTSNGSSVVAAPRPRSLHPLRHTWVFWFRQQRAPSKTLDYESGIKRIGSFASVESFWTLFTHMQPPSKLIPTTDCLLFHSGVRRPVWEDPLNHSGGKWIIRLKKGVADRLWEDLVCAVVGDQFSDDGDSGVGADAEGRTDFPEICGCTISVRNNEDILSVWNKGTDVKINAGIRDTIKRVLNLPQNIIMEYKTNSDSMGDKSSFRNSSIDRSSAQ